MNAAASATGSIIHQKITTGHIDPIDVALSGAAGFAGGALGARYGWAGGALGSGGADWLVQLHDNGWNNNKVNPFEVLTEAGLGAAIGRYGDFQNSQIDAHAGGSAAYRESLKYRYLTYVLGGASAGVGGFDPIATMEQASRGDRLGQ